jgi:2-haloacid dehalogenase
MKLRAVLFDAYGTLFDVHSVALLAEQLWPGQGERLSLLWRDKQIEYTRLVSMSGSHDKPVGAHYRPFWDLTRAGLRYAASRLNLALDIGGRRAADERVPPPQRLPENREVLAALQQRGIPPAS